MEQPQTGSKAYLISIVMVAVLGGLLFGYDTAVISGAEKGLQAFFKEAADFDYHDGWHGFTSASALIGCIIGSALSGMLATRLGRKKSLIIAGLLFFISALGSMEPEFLFFEHGVPVYSLLLMFNIYRVIGGIGVGLASAICPMYIGEVAPSNIRGMLVSWNQFAIIFGQLVVYFVNFLIIRSHANDPAVVEWTNSIGWRVMFVSEAVPAALFTILIVLVPETPRYLALNGQDEKALTVLSNINGEAKAREILAEIKATAVEKTEKLFSYGWMVIFIGCMLSVFQQIIGINAVLYFAPRIFESMGMGNPMVQTVIMGVINITFTLVAVFTVGVMASAFSSADSALTAMSTSFCIDVLDMNVSRADDTDVARRRKVHLSFVLLFLCFTLVFHYVGSGSVIDLIYTIVGYTYGPLLGLYSFGLFTRRVPKQRLVPVVALLSPVLCWVTDSVTSACFGYKFGYELLMLNGMLTFAGLWALSVRKER